MLTLENFGAVGDGVTDDRNAIYNALNSGNVITAKEGSTYYIGSSIEVSGKDINLTGNSIFLFKDTSNIKFSGINDVSTTIKTNASIDDEYIEVNDITGFAVGNLISITTSEANSWPYDTAYRNGELHEITNIIDDKIYVEDKIWTNWVIGANTLKVVQYIPITVIITGIVFKYETPQQVSGGLYIAYAKDNVLNKVIMHDAQNIGIMFHYCYNNLFKYGTVNGSNSISGGYGLRFQCSNKSRVHDSSFYRNWKSIESSSSPPISYDYSQFPNRNLEIYENYGCGCGVASDGVVLYNKGSRFVNTHASSQGVIVRNNIIDHFYYSFLTAGIDTEFKDNVISAQTQHVVLLVYGKNHIISGNTMYGIVGQANGAGGSFVLMEDLDIEGNVLIDDNNVRICQAYFIANGGTLDANNLIVSNNNVEFEDRLCWVYADKSRNIDIEESNNIYIGTNVQETKD